MSNYLSILFFTLAIIWFNNYANGDKVIKKVFKNFEENLFQELDQFSSFPDKDSEDISVQHKLEPILFSRRRRSFPDNPGEQQAVEFPDKTHLDGIPNNPKDVFPDPANIEPVKPPETNALISEQKINKSDSDKMTVHQNEIVQKPEESQNIVAGQKPGMNLPVQSQGIALGQQQMQPLVKAESNVAVQGPAQVQNHINELQQSVQVQKNIIGQSALAQNNINGLQQPAQAQSNINGLQQPAQAQSNINGLQQPAQAQSNINGLQQPAQAQSNINGLQQPAQAQSNINGLQQPAQVQSNINGLQQPAQAQAPNNINGLQQPAQAQAPNNINGLQQPAQAQAPNNINGLQQPAQAPNNMNGLQQPGQAQNNVNGLQQPAQAQNNVNGLQQPAQAQSINGLQPVQVQNNANGLQQQAQAQNSLTGQKMPLISKIWEQQQLSDHAQSKNSLAHVSEENSLNKPVLSPNGQSANDLNQVKNDVPISQQGQSQIDQNSLPLDQPNYPVVKPIQGQQLIDNGGLSAETQNHPIDNDGLSVNEEKPRLINNNDQYVDQPVGDKQHLPTNKVNSPSEFDMNNNLHPDHDTSNELNVKQQGSQQQQQPNVYITSQSVQLGQISVTPSKVDLSKAPFSPSSTIRNSQKESEQNQEFGKQDDGWYYNQEIDDSLHQGVTESEKHAGKQMLMSAHHFDIPLGALAGAKMFNSDLWQKNRKQYLVNKKSETFEPMSMALFYSWIALATLAVLAILTIFRHRHKVTGYVYDLRYWHNGGYVEEGRRLLHNAYA